MATVCNQEGYHPRVAEGGWLIGNPLPVDASFQGPALSPITARGSYPISKESSRAASTTGARKEMAPSTLEALTALVGGI